MKGNHHCRYYGSRIWSRDNFYCFWLWPTLFWESTYDITKADQGKAQVEKKEKQVAATTKNDMCKSSILKEIVLAGNRLRGKLDKKKRANIIWKELLAAEVDNGNEALKHDIGALEQFIKHSIQPKCEKMLMPRN